MHSPHSRTTTLGVGVILDWFAFHVLFRIHFPRGRCRCVFRGRCSFLPFPVVKVAISLSQGKGATAAWAPSVSDCLCVPNHHVSL